MPGPAIGDLVRYEGARWHVVSAGAASLQRFGAEFKPVSEPYVVLRPDHPADDAGDGHDMKVPQSRWGDIEIIPDSL